MKKLKITFKGLTIIELIIVITIISILSTITFISFQNYLKDARDGNRIASITKLKNGLDLYALKTLKYPEPENVYGSGYINGVELIRAGYIKDNISRIINIDKTLTDPKSHEHYVYGVDYSNKYYQIATTLENSQISIIIPTTYTNSYGVKLVGNYKGLLKKENIIYNPWSLIFIANGSNDLTEPIYYVEDKGLNFPYKLNSNMVLTGGTTKISTGINITKENWNSLIGTLKNDLGYSLDLIGIIRFGEKVYNEEIKDNTNNELTKIDFNTNLYNLSDDNLKKVFKIHLEDGFENVYTETWNSGSYTCDFENMSIVNLDSSFVGGILNTDTIYKISNGTYNLTSRIDLGKCSGLIGQSAEYVEIRGNQLYANNSKNNIILNNISVSASISNGIYFSYPENISINKIISYNNIGAGIRFQAGYSNANNIQVYNNGSSYGLRFEGWGKAYLNNVLAFNNVGDGIRAKDGSGHAFTNIISFNNSKSGIHFRSHLYGVFKNIYTFNNLQDGINVRDDSNAKLENIYSYNNQLGGLRSSHLNNVVKYYGNTKLFGNIGGNIYDEITTISFGNDGYLGFSNGILDETGTMSCDWHIQPNVGLDFGSNCDTTGRIPGTVTKISGFNFGANIGNQQESIIKFKHTGTLLQGDYSDYKFYGNYNSNKEIGTW